MKKQNSKGITLIALVITIIVLLILAGVSIAMLTGENGILKQAQNAKTKTEEASEDEQAKLLQIEYQIAKEAGDTTGSFTDYILETKYNGVKIGDIVNYDEGTGYSYKTDTTKGIGGSVGTKDSTTGKYPLNEKTYTTENLTWRVLGVNSKGELELISENPMTDIVYLANEEGYLYGPDELDKMCNDLYGKGEHSTGARSLNIDDVNTLGNYNPTTTYSGYGNKWTYRFPQSGSYMQYRTISADGKTTIKDWTDITNLDYQTFRMPGATETISISNKKESEELTYTYYSYTVANQVKQTTSDEKKMSDIITKGTGTSNISQWLASRCIRCFSDYAYFGVRYLRYGDVYSYTLFGSRGGCNNNSDRIRPVVSLSSDIQLSGSSAEGWTIE